MTEHTEERAETHACDCISRRAAIEAMTSGVILVTNNNVDAVKKVIELFIDKIKNLPAAQPEIVRCKGCKHFDVNGWCNYLETAMRPNDYCSRAKRRTDENNNE